MPFGWWRSKGSSSRKSSKQFRSVISVAPMHTRTVRDVLGELFTLLFKRSETSANPGEVFDQLTPREREIALLASQGYTNKEIAEQLVIAPDTVKTHMRNILTKLGLHSKAELRLYWANRDWSKSDE